MSGFGGPPPAPSLSGFISWIRAVMGITPQQLPDSSVSIGWALAVALDIVNQYLSVVGNAYTGLPKTNIYTLAVYNLGGDNLINYAPDVPDAPVYKNGLPFFAYMRSQFHISAFVAGVVESSSDQGTGESLAVPDALRQLTIGQLQNLRTPWGRQYLTFAQSWGPNLWGLS